MDASTRKSPSKVHQKLMVGEGEKKRKSTTLPCLWFVFLPPKLIIIGWVLEMCAVVLPCEGNRFRQGKRGQQELYFVQPFCRRGAAAARARSVGEDILVHFTHVSAEVLFMLMWTDPQVSSDPNFYLFFSLFVRMMGQGRGGGRGCDRSALPNNDKRRRTALVGFLSVCGLVAQPRWGSGAEET